MRSLVTANIALLFLQGVLVPARAGAVRVRRRPSRHAQGVQRRRLLQGRQHPEETRAINHLLFDQANRNIDEMASL